MAAGCGHAPATSLMVALRRTAAAPFRFTLPRRWKTLASVGTVLIFAGLFTPVTVHAATAGTITTFAGGNAIGDGGAPTGAALNGPKQVATDGAGSLYIADFSNNRIRKVTPGGDGVIGQTSASGQMADTDDSITTVAGTGLSGYAGDGQSATSAELSQPSGVSVDSAGNLWIADFSNNRVRFVCLRTTACSLPSGAGGPSVAPGTITTVAGDGIANESGNGGAATSAGLSQPSAVAFDAAGNLYVNDSSLETIRFVCLQATPCVNANWYGTLNPGDIAKLAGLAQLSQSDSGDGGPATSAGLNQPDGVAVDPSTGNLFIAELLGDRIREVTASTGIIRTLTTGPGSGYFEPNQIQFSNSGGTNRLYISDSGNYDILRLDLSTLAYTTLAGTPGQCGFSGDGGAATSATICVPAGVVHTATGEMFVSDSRNLRIRKVNTTGTIVTVAGDGQTVATGDGNPATQAGLSDPWDVATDGAGDAFIADLNDNRVRFVCSKAGGCVLPGGTVAQGHIATLAGNGAGVESGDGGAATSAGLYNPGGVALDTSGNLYIADYSGLRVRFVCLQATACTLPSGAGGPSVASGKITTIAGTGALGSSGDGGPANQSALSGPEGLAVDRSGNLFFVAGDQHVRFVCLQAAACTLPAGAGGPQLSSGFITTVAGQAGNGGYTGDGGSATAARLLAPSYVTPDGAGNLYIADGGNNAVRFVCMQATICGSPFGLLPSGDITTVAGQGPTAAGFSGDGGQAKAAKLADPTGVGTDSAGNLYLSDASNQRVRFICMQHSCPDSLSSLGIAQGDITTLAGNGTAGFAGDGGPANSAELNGPFGLGLDPANDLFVAERNNNVVREVTVPATLQPYPTPLFPSFATQPVGTTSPAQTVTLHNPTSSAVSVSSVAISGNNPSDYSITAGGDQCSGHSVAGGGTCAVQVTFSPIASGQRQATLTFTNSGGPTSTQTAGLVGTAPGTAPVVAALDMAPSPIAAPASLGATTTASVTLTARDSGGNPLPGVAVYLSLSRTTGGGSASVGTTALSSTPQAFTGNGSGQVVVAYKTPSTLPSGGEDIIVAQNTASNPTVTAQDTYVFTKASAFSWSRSPIATTGSLGSNSSVKVVLTVRNSSGAIVAGAKVYLSFVPTAGGGSAKKGTTALSATPKLFTANSKGQLTITYTTPGSPPASGTDTLRAADATSNPSVVAQDIYTF